MPEQGHCERYFREVAEIAAALDHKKLERIVSNMVVLRDCGGRLFFIGVGGGAANCSHAVNDFRKICGIEAYTPVDNVSELTARINDEGWESVFAAWLQTSRASEKDAVFVFSVGGGDVERNVSANIVAALQEAKRRGLKIFGVVGRESGYAFTVGDEVIVIPVTVPARLTPHTEAFQAAVWHCIVSHPALQQQEMKWERSLATRESAAE